MELRYCPKHERLYDDTEHQWISFLRGDVRLIRTIYPREGALSFQEDVCDWCVGLDRCEESDSTYPCSAFIGLVLDSPPPSSL